MRSERERGELTLDVLEGQADQADQAKRADAGNELAPEELSWLLPRASCGKVVRAEREGRVGELVIHELSLQKEAESCSAISPHNQ
jgi:hypothetical protein